MIVLIACETSGMLRQRFHTMGHGVVSCDLLPCDDPDHESAEFHCVGPVQSLLHHDWDMIIAHPPCTYLCSSGMHWTTRGLRDPQATEDALAFVRLFLDHPCKRICVENPVGAISTRIRPASQYIQPYQFGDDASKKTGLWLKGLPPLIPTAHVPPRIVDGKKRWGNQTDSGQNRLAPSSDRWKKRSQTYPGIADAMAEQWGKLT